MKKKVIEAVVFDMDGIILDTEKVYLDCWIKVGNKYHLKDMEIPAYQSIGVNWQETVKLIKDFFGDDFKEEIMCQEFFHYVEEAFHEFEIPLKPGIKELLCYLEKEGYKIGLASSSDRAQIEKILYHYGFKGYFHALACGDEIRNSKPDPDIYLTACKHLNVDPVKAVAIEDSFNGIRSAYNAGMIPIMVPDLIPANEEMGEKSEAIFKDLHQVLEWIKENRA